MKTLTIAEVENGWIVYVSDNTGARLKTFVYESPFKLKDDILDLMVLIGLVPAVVDPPGIQTA